MVKVMFKFMLLFFSITSFAGMVFFDANGDGIFNNNEKGIGNVLVTDGVNIVKTNSQGEFVLTPHKNAKHIYISVPDGYRANNRFYRTLKEKAHFPLVKWQSPAQFVQITDGEIATEKPWMKYVENYLKKNKSSFLIYTGDIAANKPDGLKFAQKRFTFNKMSTPVYFTIGNHDFTKGKTGDDAYLTYCGPLWYSFDSNDVHYVVVPMIWDGKGQRKDKPVSYKVADFANWVKKDLAQVKKNKKIVFFGHAPIFDNPEAVKIIQPQKYNIIAFIHGHIHCSGVYEIANVKHFSVSSIKGGFPFPSFGVYNFSKSGELIRQEVIVGATFSKPKKAKNLKWHYKNNNGNYLFANPVVKDHMLIVNLSDIYNKKHQLIQAFNKDNGKLLWSYKLKNSCVSKMALKDNKLFVADVDGRVYALNINNGNLFWKNRFSLQNGVFYKQGVVCFEDKVIAGFGDYFSAFDIKSGKILWTTKGKKGKKAKWGTGAASILANNVVISADNGKRCAINAKSGKLLWQGKAYNFSTPVYSNGKLFAYNGNLLSQINLTTGKIIRTYPNLPQDWQGVFTPLIEDDTIYTGSVKLGLSSASISSGNLLWQFLPKVGRIPSQKGGLKSVLGELAIYKHIIFCSALDGSVYALNKSNGKVLWQFDTTNVVNGLTIDNNNLYVTDYFGNLYCFDLLAISNLEKNLAKEKILSKNKITPKEVIVKNSNSKVKFLDLSNPVIIVPQNAFETTLFAAKELQLHLELITNKKLAIHFENNLPKASYSAYIYLGLCNKTKLFGLSTLGMYNFDWLIRAKGNTLFLLGLDSPESMAKNYKTGGLGLSCGSLSAVYDFLDRNMHVRHIWPGKSGIYFKKNMSLKIPLPLNRRGGHWGITSRFNVGIFKSYNKFWKYQNQFMEAQQLWLYRQRFFLVERQVGSGHSYEKYYQRFGKSNPNFFQMLPNRKRGPLPNDTQGIRVSMCVSNPNLIKQIAKDYSKIFNNKNLSTFVRNRAAIGENDTPGMCCCPNCRQLDAPQENAKFTNHPYWGKKNIPVVKERFPALGAVDGGGLNEQSPSLSDRYCRFYLDVQQELRKINPNVNIFGYAYANYANSPHNVTLNKNIFIGIVDWPYFPFTPKKMEQVKQNWNNWLATGAKLIIRPNSTHSGHNMPLFYGRQLGEAFRYSQRTGAWAVTYDSLIGQWGAQSASYYCIGRLNARPDLTVDEVLEEYYSAFGPAKKEVKEFVKFLEETSNKVTQEDLLKHTKKMNLGRIPDFKNWLQAADLVFSTKFFIEGEKLLNKALLAAKNDINALEKVKYLQVGFQHAKLTFEVLLAQRSGNKVVLKTKVAQLIKYRKSIEHLLTCDMAYLQARENYSSWHR